MGDFEPEVAYCGWFLLCENLATTMRYHPILGEVPICDRCNDKMKKIEEKTR